MDGEGLPSLAPTSGATALTNLPPELLQHILGFFQHPGVSYQGRTITHPACPIGALADRRRTIQNARLSCRVLSDAASPFLCPIMRLRISNESLESAGRLLDNPLIASGVRGFEVVLSYWPQHHPTDLVACFTKFVLDWYTSRDVAWCLLQIGYQERGHEENLIKEAHELCGQMAKVLTDFDKAALSRVGEPRGDNEAPAALRRLRGYHRKYQELQREQCDMIVDGTFVDGAAACMSRLGHPVALAMADTVEAFAATDGGDPDYRKLPDTAQGILDRLMLSPRNWYDIELLFRGVAWILPVNILWQLPIACHRVGVCVRQLAIHCFPMGAPGAFAHIKHPFLPRSSWDDVTPAVQHLEDLSVVPHRKPSANASDQPIDDELDQFHGFVRALLSGPSLTSLKLDMDQYRLMHCRDRGWRSSSSALNGLPLRLKSLALISVDISQKVIDTLIRGMRSDLESLRLRYVHLTVGKWQPIFDIIESKLGPLLDTRRPDKDEVDILTLSGGRFDILGLSGGEFRTG